MQTPDDSDAASVRLLRALIDNLPEAAWIVDRDLRLVLANEPFRGFQRLMGGEGTADGEASVRIGGCPGEVQAWDVLYGRALAGEPFSEELIFTSASGERTVEVTFQPVWEADEPSCIAVTARDVTLRKHTEDALRTAEHRLAAAMEGSDVGLWEWSLGTGDVTVDRRWIATVGWSCDDDALTLSPEMQAELVHPDDRRWAVALLADYLTDASSLFEAELRVRHRDGRWVRLLVRGRVTAWDEAGQPLLMSGTHLDVSEAASAREAIALGAERLRAVSDAMLDPQALIEPVRTESGEIVDFALLDANQAMCAHCGMPRAEVLQTTLATLFPDAALCGLLSHCAHVADSGEPLVLDEFPCYDELLGAYRYHDLRASLAGAAVSLTWRDVTERHEAAERERRAAEALAASEERFRSLYESMAQGVVFQDADGHITAANPAAERILGLSLDQLQGRTSTDPRWRAVREDGSGFPGDEHPAMEALRSGGSIHGAQMGVYHPGTDSLHWLLVDSVPQFLEGQESPYQVYSVFTDITALRTAEAALRESEDRFKYIFDRSAVGMVIRSPEGRITAVNDALCRMLGYTREELQDSEIGMLMCAEDAALVRDELAAMVAGRLSEVHARRRLRARDGSPRWGEVSFSLRRDGDGTPLYFIVSLVDVTAQVEAAAALRESEDLFKYIFDHSAVGKVIRTPEGRITAVNDTLCRMLGYAREELMRSDLGLITLPEDLAATLDLRDAMLAGSRGDSRRRRRFVAKDGSVRWGDVASSLRHDAEGRPMYFINSIVDITEQVAAAEEIDRLIAMRDVAEQVARMGSFSWDLTTGLAAWSPEVDRLFDMEGRDVGGDFRVLIEERVHPEDRERLRELFNVHLHTGNALDHEYRVVHRDGSEHILHSTATAEPAEEGRNARITGFVRDVTAERHAEEAAAAAAGRLAESEATLRAIVENAAEGINLLDLRTGRYVFMSPRQVELTGFTAEEMNGLSAEEVYERCHPDDRDVSVEQQRRLAAGEIDFGATEYRWKVKSGEYRWFRDSRRVLRDADGRPRALVGVSSDITARKQLERELRESRDEYRLMLETEQAAGEEHRHIARSLHDAVAQNVFSASLIAESLPAIFEQAPEQALDDVVLIRRLIRAVFAELRFLLFELRPETLAVDSMETLLQRLGDALAAKADLTVDLDLDKELVLPPDVRAAFYRIAQEAFNNVARSARATHVSVALKRADETARLEIRDDGQGFDVVSCPSGMGIDIMRERAESIGAHLDIESTPGVGTTVRLAWRESGSGGQAG